MAIVVSPENTNALLPIEVNCDVPTNVTVRRSEHCPKATAPIEVTDSGTVTAVMVVQP
jgi:hypothetical protein